MESIDEQMARKRACRPRSRILKDLKDVETQLESEDTGPESRNLRKPTQDGKGDGEDECINDRIIFRHPSSSVNCLQCH